MDRRERRCLTRRCRGAAARPGTRGYSRTRRQRVEAVAFLPGRGRCLLVRAGGDQRGVQVDHHPAHQGLPGDGQPREPRGGAFDQRPYVRPALARARAIRSSMAAAPRARRTVGPLGAVPSTGPGASAPRYRSCWSPPARPPPPSRPGRFPGPEPVMSPPSERRAQPGGQSRLVSGRAEQDRADVPDQAGPAASDLQGTVPPRILHGQERSSLPGSCPGCGDLQSPKTRALFAVIAKKRSAG